MGIGALVVDLGFSWMLRRQEQNAADPASIAAARWLKDSMGNLQDPRPMAYEEACFYAKQNGFFVGDDATCSAARAAGDLEVNWPPVSGDYAGDSTKVQVIISSTHPSFFARVFGQDFATVTTAAVAANDAGDSNSSSLVALQTECQAGSAGDISGGGEVRIFPVNPGDLGGYVHVNSSCGSSTDNLCTNGVGQAALSISGTLTTPYAFVTGSCTVQGSDPDEGLQCEPDTVTSCLTEDSFPPLADPLKNLPEPRLSDFPAGVCPDGTVLSPTSTSGCVLRQNTVDAYCPKVGSDFVCTLPPGVYYGGLNVQKNVAINLTDGMYILAGGGIDVSSDSRIEAVNGDGSEARVTIFSTDGPGCPSIGDQCQGGIKFTAQSKFVAKATNLTSCQASVPTICTWRGILLWQDGSVHQPATSVNLGGQASSILSGTIYAPLAEVQITGGTDTTGCDPAFPDTQSCLSIQIISNRWKIAGGGFVEMPYDPSELYQFPARGLLE
jgi:hypothetical protein